jgi:hypothetical protein
MKNILIILCIFFICTKNLKAQVYYEDAYTTLNAMLLDSTKYNFKKAVFTVENAYEYGELDTISLNKNIKTLSNLIMSVVKSRKLKNYNYRDRSKIEKYASLFTVMTDTIKFNIQGKEIDWLPYKYDFDDIWGIDSWSNMFVSKLLYTKKGNCHSMPYLYKILAEELGETAHLALAPNHVYIKHRNEKNGWYNTELTSGIFPKDAWIMASGYVHLNAIRNGLYMKALNNNESIALMFIDLAQGYQKRFPEIIDTTFVMKCCETALKYFPNLPTALILKLETTKKELEYYAEEKGKTVEQIFKEPKAKEIFKNLTNQVRHISDLGYRQMPKEMYLDWLISLQKEKAKYTNKKISTFNKPN